MQYWSLLLIIFIVFIIVIIINIIIITLSIIIINIIIISLPTPMKLSDGLRFHSCLFVCLFVYLFVDMLVTSWSMHCSLMKLHQHKLSALELHSIDFGMLRSMLKVRRKLQAIIAHMSLATSNATNTKLAKITNRNFLKFIPMR